MLPDNFTTSPSCSPGGRRHSAGGSRRTCAAWSKRSRKRAAAPLASWAGQTPSEHEASDLANQERACTWFHGGAAMQPPTGLGKQKIAANQGTAVLFDAAAATIFSQVVRHHSQSLQSLVTWRAPSKFLTTSNVNRSWRERGELLLVCLERHRFNPSF